MLVFIMVFFEFISGSLNLHEFFEFFWGAPRGNRLWVEPLVELVDSTLVALKSGYEYW